MVWPVVTGEDDLVDIFPALDPTPMLFFGRMIRAQYVVLRPRNETVLERRFRKVFDFFNVLSPPLLGGNDGAAHGYCGSKAMTVLRGKYLEKTTLESRHAVAQGVDGPVMHMRPITATS